MRDITLEELLEAGCHFGHQVNRRNPRADDYIFEERNNVHIINLENTRNGLLKAAEFVKNLAVKDGKLLIVGTKRQAHAVIADEIERFKQAVKNPEEKDLGLYYITTRWIGGVLTNFSEVSKNFKKLKDLGEFLANDKIPEGYTKRELVLMDKERQKLLMFYGGVQNMDRIPDAVFIVDTHHEHTAVSEAKSVNVATIGITDTNADPTSVNIAIPSNDDAVGALKLIISYIIDAWIEGSDLRKAEGDRLLDQSEATGADKRGTQKAKNEVKAAAEVQKTEEKTEVKVDEKPKEVKAVLVKKAVKKKAAGKKNTKSQAPNPK